MLIAKIIIGTLSFITLFIALSVLYDKEERFYSILYTVVLCSSILLAITFCVLLALPHFPVFAIFKIVLFVSVYFYFLFSSSPYSSHNSKEIGFWVSFIIVVFAFILSSVLYYKNIRESEEPEVSVITYPLISARDVITVSEKKYGSFLIQQDYISEKLVYVYYYRLENGGFKSDTIPADSTTIYYLESCTQPYLEEITITSYWVNHNKIPERCIVKSSVVTYRLCVPEDAIINEFEFDSE